jgi:hypothetical protein
VTTEPRHKGLADALASMVVSLHDVPANGHGVDVDIDGILTELEAEGIDSGDADAKTVIDSWINVVAADVLSTEMPDGTLKLYRAVKADGIGEVVAHCETDGLGCHWTTKIGLASSAYDTGASANGRDFVLVASVPVVSLDLEETFRAHLAHPWEREVYVIGTALLMSVVDTKNAETVWSPNSTFSSVIDVPCHAHKH